MPAYEWKNGSRIKADAQAAGEQMRMLSQTEEGLTARSLLNANLSEGTPLHNDYEWIDATAADKWRLQQSNQFINSIVIIDLKKPDTQENAEPQRAFHITVEPHKYEPIEVIVQHEDKYRTLLQSALSDLRAFERKYEALKELHPLLSAVKKAVTDIQERVRG